MMIESRLVVGAPSVSPTTITVQKGTTVTWTNAVGVQHAVTGDSNAIASSLLGSGATYPFTFNDVGEFSYHCDVHPTMTGAVIVAE